MCGFDLGSGLETKHFHDLLLEGFIFHHLDEFLCIERFFLWHGTPPFGVWIFEVSQLLR
jgi:hypothetical protein